MIQIALMFAGTAIALILAAGLIVLALDRMFGGIFRCYIARMIGKGPERIMP